MSKKEKDLGHIVLDGNTGLWNMASQGDIQGTYIGTFRFRCFLSPLQRIEAISFSLDSWGGDPFMVWLDGLTVE